MTSALRSLGLGIIVCGALVVGSQAFAHVGPAGCGLGSLIIEKDTIVSQTAAETTNASFSSQFFGITSGTSNCNANGFVMREKEAEHFAEANMQNLEVDMARGHGESLSAFAQILGCKEGAVSTFGRMTQSHYENIFPKANVDAPSMIRSVEKEMINDVQVRQGCLQQTS